MIKRCPFWMSSVIWNHPCSKAKHVKLYRLPKSFLNFCWRLFEFDSWSELTRNIWWRKTFHGCRFLLQFISILLVLSCSEADVQRCSVKKVFLEISKNTFFTEKLWWLLLPVAAFLKLSVWNMVWADWKILSQFYQCTALY